MLSKPWPAGDFPDTDTIDLLPVDQYQDCAECKGQHAAQRYTWGVPHPLVQETLLGCEFGQMGQGRNPSKESVRNHVRTMKDPAQGLTGGSAPWWQAAWGSYHTSFGFLFQIRLWQPFLLQ